MTAHKSTQSGLNAVNSEPEKETHAFRRLGSEQKTEGE